MAQTRTVGFSDKAWEKVLQGYELWKKTFPQGTMNLSMNKFIQHAVISYIDGVLEGNSKEQVQ